MVTATTTVRFEISAVIGRTVRTINRAPLQFALLGLLAAIPIAATGLIPRVPFECVFWFPDCPPEWSQYYSFSRDIAPHSVMLDGLFLAPSMFDFGIIYFLYAALAQATAAVASGRPLSVFRCLRAGLRDAPALLFIAVLFVAALLVIEFFRPLLPLLILSGTFVTVIWSLPAAVRALEGTSTLRALTRCAELTRGHRVPIVWIMIAFLVPSYAAGYLATYFLVEVLTAFGLQDSYKAFFAGWGAVYAVFSVPVGVFSALLYYELGGTKQSIGPEQMAAVFD